MTYNKKRQKYLYYTNVISVLETLEKKPLCFTLTNDKVLQNNKAFSICKKLVNRNMAQSATSTEQINTYMKDEIITFKINDRGIQALGQCKLIINMIKGDWHNAHSYITQRKYCMAMVGLAFILFIFMIIRNANTMFLSSAFVIIIFATLAYMWNTLNVQKSNKRASSIEAQFGNILKKPQQENRYL